MNSRGSLHFLLEALDEFVCGGECHRCECSDHSCAHSEVSGSEGRAEGGGQSQEESKLLSGGLGDASFYPAKHLQPNINGGCDFETEGSANMP